MLVGSTDPTAIGGDHRQHVVDDRGRRQVLGDLASRKSALQIGRRRLHISLGTMRYGQRVVDREQSIEIADVLSPLEC
jgi:hypothetical protein